MRDMLFNSDIGWVEYRENGKKRGRLEERRKTLGKAQG